MTRDDVLMRKDKGFINKMNLILVQVRNESVYVLITKMD